MSEVPAWIQILQALLTPAIALAVGVIAYRQWRTAHEKVMLDLFEKRFEVFMSVREIVSKGGIRRLFRDPGLPNEVVARGRFLFDEDVTAQLQEVHRLCGQVETGSTTASGELYDLFPSIMAKMDPYMRMTHKRNTMREWLLERNRIRLSYADEKQQ
ncbi:hypothetical protein [Rhizobium sp. BT-226]|uniref:hypothetical protein n=1 Tax=Rhizobium sp. BT-226 TaxID=2986922 RepID=UPI0021F72CA3|nr:hypothetical protein [Rhizobium sp. BT-226]MCW0016254.1 hypothetical protein [Rhizobium sp. BT-226]